MECDIFLLDICVTTPTKLKKEVNIMAILRRDSTLWVDYESLDKNCQVERNEAYETYNLKVIEYENKTDYVFYDYSIMKMKKGIEKPKKSKKEKSEIRK